MRETVELVESCLARVGGGKGARYVLAWLVEVDPSAISLWLQAKRVLTPKHRAVLEQIFAAEKIEINLKPLTRVVVPAEERNRASPPRKRTGGSGG